MNWGYRIFFSFLVFGALIITMVIISMRQDISLVYEDYYEKEIAYQDQIDRITNYNRLEEKPTLSIDREAGTCIISFPESIRTSRLEGTVHFFRPSDADLDRIYEMVIDEGTGIQMDIGDLPAGMWSVKVEWKDKSNEYYFEKTVHL